ncbi:hypothetical protein BS47DRAFT_462392 [Hydnum rufescens UP504]|uniref:Uncharacterized protein n=1 Tax=Hydnum rufescens UP504 TaxID=1448309 RepID=A0A9P6AHT4_9AGAM|nr:hypothetical protein BS47DRAFT_462392 [Hydnum rufescens UP504]
METTRYRGLLRELRKSGYSASARRWIVPATSVRIVFDAARAADSSRKEHIMRTLESAHTFLKAQREHQGLLARYNPLHDLTSEEHLKATANRVGLNMPLDVDLTKPS